MRIELPAALRVPGRLATLLGAVPVGISPCTFGGIATHSAEVQAGDLFVALPGKWANGMSFAPSALSKGAVAVLASKRVQSLPGCPLLLTEDPIAALLRAAAAYRQSTASFLIAISGSTGKTTVKEATARMLQGRGRVAYSKGNFNSTLGLPLSMLSFAECDYWVNEIGINHPGEMEPMTRAAAPDLAVLTNVGSAHIGNYRDREELLAQKASIALGLRPQGRLLVPAELPRRFFSCDGSQIYTFGAGGMFHLEGIHIEKNGVGGDLVAPDRIITNLIWPLPGESGVRVLETVGAIGILLGLGDDEIRQGIAVAAEQTPRMQERQVGGFLLLDDGYNASPEATIEALSVLKRRTIDRPTVAVLGDMLELGVHSEALHRSVGAAVFQKEISMLITYGKQAAYIAEQAMADGMDAAAVLSFDEDQRAALVNAVCRTAPKGAAILFKASGKMQISRLASEVASQL